MLVMELTANNVASVRFGVSPMVELTQSLALLATRRSDLPHRVWLRSARDRLAAVFPLLALAEVVAGCPRLRAVLCSLPADLTTTVDQQLATLRDAPAGRGARGWAWLGDAREEAALATVARDGPGRLADLLRDYWSVALQPHWATVRRTLSDDVAYRSQQQARHGTTAMIRGLHPALGTDAGRLTVDADVVTGPASGRVAVGSELVLVPSVFTPDVVLAVGRAGSSALLYPARGAGDVWTTRTGAPDEHSLAALLGRRRAAILACLDVPLSTTEVALRLGQTPPSVNQHLSVLRACGLVTSWRSGRSVLYRQTALGADLVGADPQQGGQAVDDA